MGNWIAGVRNWYTQLDADQPDVADVPNRWLRTAIVATSALALYLELVLVRWHSACFHVFSIFKNVSLLSCFLGLAIGFSLASKRKSLMGGFLPLLALQLVLFGLVSLTSLRSHGFNPISEQLVMGKADKASLITTIEGTSFLAVVFLLNALLFIPLGHLVGRLMTKLPPLHAYSLNLLGSLLGIVLFSLLSLFWSPPAVWIGLAILAIAPFLAGQPRSAGVTVACMASIVLVFGLMNRASERRYYTPYQVITLCLPEAEDSITTPMLRVNHAFFQRIWDCTPGIKPTSELHAQAISYYNKPYQLKKKPADVLVVGAGTGNDVAGALRNGAGSVTAVEIDPTIVYLGQRLHPERPYSDPRTKVEVNDARTYMRQTDRQFDVIVYGLLDSHTNLGSMSNVRLDSFVYTVQGFKEAVARLKDDGLILVSYAEINPKQGDRLFAMLSEAYPDQSPKVLIGDGGAHFITGPGLKSLPKNIAGDNAAAYLARGAQHTECATDDWPFFYMKERTYPVSYMAMILVLLVLSLLLIRRQLGSLPGIGVNLNGAFFFLGAGFMLVETKGITELGLFFGNTWMVIGVIISGILIMVFLANQWIAKYGVASPTKAFACLFVALAAGWGVNAYIIAGGAVPLGWLVMPVVLTLPLFFAGLIFSSELKRGGDISSALSANLFGSMLGGFLEYNSMYAGFQSLYPLGMALYGLAFVCLLRARRAGAVQGDVNGDTQLQQAA